MKKICLYKENVFTLSKKRTIKSIIHYIIKGIILSSLSREKDLYKMQKHKSRT
ncbi:hypothetical protein AFV9_gp20 [Betalipothrixvirus uzonense]|uniref:Uncharacterized protein n=1 Tax=Betalipothrixvirus uzonense TaxID=512792 RepID=B2CRJ7_9VIRU|nr:hypothetical protein AFV9_gp20 [Acidianus filamentous virus 9]ACB37254.1 hypothetical protein [Acidianus filamentous virus 9]